MSGENRNWKVAAVVVLAAVLTFSPAMSLISIQTFGGPTLVPLGVSGFSPPTLAEYGKIELGYSSSTLEVANVSVPTFTLGDQLWAMSQFNTSVGVMVLSPGGTLVSNYTLQSHLASMIFSFSSSYYQGGTWLLNFSHTFLGNFSLPVTFVNPASHAILATIGSYGFAADSLSVGFSISSVSTYGIQGCLLPKIALTAIDLKTPPSVGGNFAIQGEGNSSVLAYTGKLASPYIPTSSVPIPSSASNSTEPAETFEFWLELYYPYSSQATGGASFVSNYIEAAKTNPVLLSAANESASLPLEALVGLRNGIYELRAYFQVGGNLSVEQTSVLLQGNSASWAALGDCAMSPVGAPSFFVSSPLSNSSLEQPSDLFLSYYSEGVNLYSILPLALQLNEFTLFVDSLQQVPTNIGIEVTISGGQYKIVGESVFIASMDPSVKANYSLTFGGKVFEKFPSTVLESYATEGVDLGRLTVLLTDKGLAYPNATVSLLNNALGGNVTLVSNRNGNATFFGPPGNYTLSVSVNGSTFTRIVSIAAGESSATIMSLNNASGVAFSTEEVEIVVIGSILVVVGIVADLWIWIIRPRRIMRR